MKGEFTPRIGRCIRGLKATRASRCSASIRSAAQRIDDLDAVEILRVVSDDDAAIGFGHSGDDGVECASRPAAGLPVGHEARPDQGGRLVKGKNPAGEQRLRTLGTAKPAFQIVRLLPAGFSRMPRRISAIVSEAM